jgi:hypothetical protein
MNVFVGASLLVGLMFVAVIASTLVGGIVGWVVSFPFQFVFDIINTQLGTNYTGFEIGATVAFIGSFFRTHAKIQSNS